MFFCDGFLMHYFILKLFPKCDTPNLIYVINHVEKTFRDLRCQKSGEYLTKKKQKKRITEHLKKSTFLFFGLI